MARSAELRHNVFLALEESLNNMLKDSGGSRVRVEIRVDPRILQIIINDNGRGFDVPAEDSAMPAEISGTSRMGNGLVNMRQRLADVGGQCSIQSRVNEGTSVTLRMRVTWENLHRQLAS